MCVCAYMQTYVRTYEELMAALFLHCWFPKAQLDNSHVHMTFLRLLSLDWTRGHLHKNHYKLPIAYLEISSATPSTTSGLQPTSSSIGEHHIYIICSRTCKSPSKTNFFYRQFAASNGKCKHGRMFRGSDRRMTFLHSTNCGAFVILCPFYGFLNVDVFS